VSGGWNRKSLLMIPASKNRERKGETDMLFELENIGKIGEARIELPGITVLAGRNDTGKSTIGKALYCLVNSFADSTETVLQERKDQFRSRVNRAVLRSERDSSGAMNLAERLFENRESPQEVRRILLEAVSQGFLEDEEKAEWLIRRVEFCNSESDEQMQKDILNRSLYREFKEQVGHVACPDLPSRMALVEGDKKLETWIDDDLCVGFSDDLGLVNSGIYVNTPWLLDDSLLHDSWALWDDHRRDLLVRLLRPEPFQDTVEIARRREALLAFIGFVSPGKFQPIKHGLHFQGEDSDCGIRLENVSEGLKPFLVLQRLVENGSLREGDFLILDGPETHLHPVWQLKLVDLLVLVQQELRLTMILSTHSPYVLDALEVNVKMDGITDRCRYYLTEETGENRCGVRDVTKSTDEIHRLLAEPFGLLEEKRYW
jgi:predicted ATPase